RGLRGRTGREWRRAGRECRGRAARPGPARQAAAPGAAGPTRRRPSAGQRDGTRTRATLYRASARRSIAELAREPAREGIRERHGMLEVGQVAGLRDRDERRVADAI